MDNNYEEERGGKGALAVVVIIIVLLLVGGLYALNSGKATNNETASITDQTVATGEVLGTSTDLSDIDRDLGSLNSATIDAELDNLDKELKGI